MTRCDFKNCELCELSGFSLVGAELCYCREEEWHYDSGTFTRRVLSSDCQKEYWRLLLEQQLLEMVGSASCLSSPRFFQDPTGACLVTALPEGFSRGCGWQGAVEHLGHALEFAVALVDCVLDLHRKGIVHGDLHPRNIVLSPIDKQIRLIDFRAARITPFALDEAPMRFLLGKETGCQSWPDVEWQAVLLAEWRQMGRLLKSLLAEVAQEFCTESEQAVFAKQGVADKNSDVRIVYELIVEPLLIEDNFGRKMSLQNIRRQLGVFLQNWHRGIPFQSMSILQEPEPESRLKPTALSSHERILSLLFLLQPSGPAKKPRFPAPSVGKLSPAAFIHEVRNPNTLLRGALFHLERWSDDFEKLLGDLLEEDACTLRGLFAERFTAFRHQLTALDSGTLHIEQVLQGWSDAFPETGRRRRPGCLVVLLHRMLDLFRLRYREGITFRVDAPDAAPVLCRQGALEQVLVNVLLNACQAIERRGLHRKHQGIIYLRLTETNLTWQLCVQDNGVGLDPDREDVLNQSDGIQGGADGRGYGLSVCRQLLAEHDGRLLLRGRPQDGCEALVTLPKTTVATPAGKRTPCASSVPAEMFF